MVKSPINVSNDGKLEAKALDPSYWVNFSCLLNISSLSRKIRYKGLLPAFMVYCFSIMPKSTAELVLDVCSCLKYESIFHEIHLRETGNSLSLFQF